MTTASFYIIVQAGKQNIQGGAFAREGRKIKNNLIQTFNFLSVQIRYKEVILFTLLSGCILRSSNKHKHKAIKYLLRTLGWVCTKKPQIRDLSNTIIYICWLSVSFLNFLFQASVYTLTVLFSLIKILGLENLVFESTVFCLNLGRIFDLQVLIS